MHDRKEQEARVSDLAGPQWSEGERSEPERNGGPAKSAARSGAGKPPDPEVPQKATRRRFSAEYKARIVREADACTEYGEIGAMLRREGLYSSLLNKWRDQSRRGALSNLRDDKRGRKPTHDPLESENERLRKQNAWLRQRLGQAEAIIEIQKKVSEMLGIPLKSTESDENE